jgi:glycosyltransferase involved in cell wall biosynthesis
MKLSLIIPCYNEAANLPLLLEHCEALKNISGIEIILVNNGSTDDSARVLQILLPKYPHCRTINISINKGYGYGILSGLRAASGDLLAWTHADMQTDPADVIQGLELFKKYGPNIYAKGKRIKRPLNDVFFTVCMSIFETILLKKFMWDINAQPNMFSKSFFETLDNPPKDFSLDLYVYFMALNQGIPLHRFPVDFNLRAHGVSHWNINWKEKIKFIRRTIDFSLKLRRRFSL